MREIKFRAWDGKSMFYEMCMDVDLGDGEIFKVNFHTWPEYKFMQYTGLKDKNDKEIYEGDICKGGALKCSGGYSIFADVATVIYESGMFKLGSISLSSFNNKTEVIGNIYENPELLSGK